MYYLSLLVFLDKVLSFQSSVCNGCYDALITSYGIKNNAILNIHSVDYSLDLARVKL